MNGLRTMMRVGLVAGTFTFASTASAQTYAYFDRASFDASFPTTVTNDLNALANGSTVLSFGALGTGTLSGATVQNGVIANLNAAGNPFTFSINFSQLLNGFGADYSQSAITYRFFNDATLIAGVGLYGTNFLGAGEPLFNRVEISEISIGDPTPIGTVDNLDVGGVPTAVSPVPEPATLGLFATGLLAIGGLSVRRKRTIASQSCC